MGIFKVTAKQTYKVGENKDIKSLLSIFEGNNYTARQFCTSSDQSHIWVMLRIVQASWKKLPRANSSSNRITESNYFRSKRSYLVILLE